MKITSPRSASALAVLLPTLMLAAPVFAQDVPTQAAPAPAAQAAPAPVAPAPVPAPVFAPASPVVQDLSTPTVAPPPVVPTVSDAPAADVPAAATRPTTGSKRTVRQISPVRAAPAAMPTAATASAPVPVAPTEATLPAAAPVASAPAPVTPTTQAAPATATTEQTTTQSTLAIWPWIVGAGIVLLGLIALFASRRRRDEEVDTNEQVYDEQPSFEPTSVIAPVVALPPVEREPQILRPAAAFATEPLAAPAPVPAEDTHIVDADQADVDALTDAHAPVANRPWLEFGMRPVRAGTTSDEALVEIELTVGNAGSVSADDVRISTFLFASEPVDAADFERLLLEHGNAAVEPVSIAAGEGTRVDATLALPKRDLAALFNPVVVADARYRLADGREGRTFASFSIGMTQDDGALGAMENDRPSMHEDIEARLYGTPEHV